MNYYRRYLGDYFRDTARLTVLEHGAYNLLLDYYYAEERPISLDLEEVYRMVRAITKEEQAAVACVLKLYFKKNSDAYHHKRADHEIAVSQQARKNGSMGGRPITGMLTGFETESITGSGHPPTTILQPPTASPQPTHFPPDGGMPLLPSNIPYREIKDLYNSILGEKLPRVIDITPKRRQLIKSAWGTNGKRRDLKFWKQYFEECSEDPFLNGTGPYKEPHANWRPTFDYLMRPDTITRVYEKAMSRG